MKSRAARRESTKPNESLDLASHIDFTEGWVGVGRVAADDGDDIAADDDDAVVVDDAVLVKLPDFWITILCWLLAR